MMFGALGFSPGRRGNITPGPPPSSLARPDSPIMLESIGSRVGQIPLTFFKPNFLMGAANEPISLAPVTDTRVDVSSSWDNAEAGVTVYTANAGTAEQVTVPSVAPGTWYVSAVSINANGAGNRSHILVVTVT